MTIEEKIQSFHNKGYYLCDSDDKVLVLSKGSGEFFEVLTLSKLSKKYTIKRPNSKKLARFVTCTYN